MSNGVKLKENLSRAINTCTGDSRNSSLKNQKGFFNAALKKRTVSTYEPIKRGSSKLNMSPTSRTTSNSIVLKPKMNSNQILPVVDMDSSSSDDDNLSLVLPQF
jgi:hypothetical protein